MVLAIAATLGLVGTSSAAWSSFDGRHFRGGFVKPCSLDGVNPAYHPTFSATLHSPGRSMDSSRDATTFGA